MPSITLGGKSVVTQTTPNQPTIASNVELPASQGSSLSLISTQTFTSVTSVSFQNCFSSTYNHYKLLMQADCTAHFWLQFFTTGTTAHTSGDYSSAIAGADDDGTDSRFAHKSSVAAWTLNNDSSGKNYVDMTIYNPNLATETYFNGLTTMKRSAGKFIANFMGGAVDTTTVFTGFRVFANTYNNLVPANSVTGKISVYGIKQ